MEDLTASIQSLLETCGPDGLNARSIATSINGKGASPKTVNPTLYKMYGLGLLSKVGATPPYWHLKENNVDMKIDYIMNQIDKLSLEDQEKIRKYLTN